MNGDDDDDLVSDRDLYYEIYLESLRSLLSFESLTQFFEFVNQFDFIAILFFEIVRAFSFENSRNDSLILRNNFPTKLFPRHNFQSLIPSLSPREKQS